MATEVMIPARQCNVCGHIWVPRSPKLPYQCPSVKCRSVMWNTPPSATNITVKIDDNTSTEEDAPNLTHFEVH